VLILSGGGAHPQTDSIIEWLHHHYKSMKILYMPQAMAVLDDYAGCLKWLHEEMNNINYSITLLPTCEHYNIEDYESFDMLYIGGGNIDVLFTFLQQTNAIELIKSFYTTNRIIFGGSAGAILLGADCNAYRNYTKFNNYNGLNLCDNISFACHYAPAFYIKEHSTTYENLLEEYVKTTEERVVAIPEEVSLIIKDKMVVPIGGCYYIFNKKGHRNISQPAMIMDI